MVEKIKTAAKTAACLGFVVFLELWVLSYFQVSFVGDRTVFMLRGGAAILYSYAEHIDEEPGWHKLGFQDLRTSWWPSYSSSPWGDWTVSIPLSMPTAILAIAPMWLLVSRHRRQLRLKRGLCLRCGYDLWGTVMPTCPECGETRRQVVNDQPSASLRNQY